MGEKLEPARRAGERAQMRKPRPDGWTKEKREVFLRHLAATANVRASLRAVDVSVGAAYARRNSDAEFARQWQEALEASEEALNALTLATAMGTASMPAYDEEAIAAGNFPEPPDPASFDPQFAMEFIKMRRGIAERTRSGRKRPIANKEETARAIMALIAKVKARERRRRKRGGGEGA